ncbi:hypothetical protein [Kitasatospora griseola]|uniref:hypothetical protein n=1 Tax=Kitasatospora griseola TaxID=2064 RepID=UPI00166FB7FE|nr:hypothetical protein [Kitasatospora griseola]GGQ57251.1 hypothetical protein GCM10010195_11200 [Kitasatospora griseola]
MRKIRTLAASGVAAATLMLGVVTATPASAAQNCTTWNDDSTFGAACSQWDGHTWVYAFGDCEGKGRVYGSAVRIGSGATSYAYCSTVGAKLIGGGYTGY